MERWGQQESGRGAFQSYESRGLDHFSRHVSSILATDRIE
jgi:hypothetical protein